MTIKHSVIWKIIVALIFVVMILFATSRVASQITEQTGEIVNAQSNVVDMSFFSGDKINLKVTSTDDVFAAGSTIISDTVSADHLVLAGGEITVENADVKDIFVVGGDLNMASGKLSDDLVAAGGNVRLRPGFDIGGSAVVSGGDVRIEAPVATDLRSAAGKLYLNSVVGGNAQLMGDIVELGPKARIDGNLQYRTDNIKISPNAVITGTKSVLPDDDYADYERWGKGGAALAAVFAIAVILGIALLVIVVAIAFPGLMTGASRTIREQPLRTAGIGVLLAFVTPFALLMLFATVIGIPLALMIAAIFLAATPLAFAASAYFAGMQGRRLIGKKPDDAVPSFNERLLWPTLAVVLIVLLGMIPFVGGLIWLVALIFGLGAIMPRGGRALASEAS